MLRIGVVSLHTTSKNAATTLIQRRNYAEKRCYNALQRLATPQRRCRSVEWKKTTLLQRFYNASAPLWENMQRFYNASTTLSKHFYNASTTLQKPKNKTLQLRFCGVAEASQRRCCGVVAEFFDAVINIW